MSLGYNTKLVKRNEVPKQWTDLLNSKWRGKIAINANRPEWYVGLLQIMGQVQGRPLQRNPESMSSARTSVTAFSICHITRRQRINHLLK